MVLSYYSLHAIIAFTINISIALLVLLDAPTKNENRMFYIITLFYALWNAGEALLISSQNVTQAYIGIILISASSYYIPAFFLVMSFKFPFEYPRLKLRWYLTVLIFLIPTVLALLSTDFLSLNYTLDRVFEKEKTFWIPLDWSSPYTYIKIIQTTIYLLLGSYILWKKNNILHNIREKFGIMYLLIENAIFYILFLFLNVREGGENLFLIMSSFLLVGSSLLNAYYILGNKIINFRRLYKGSLRFTLLSTLIVSTYIFLLKTISGLFSSVYSNNTVLIDFMIIFSLVLIFNPVIIKVQDWLPRIISGENLKYKNRYLEFDNQIKNIFSLNELIDKIKDFIFSVFNPEKLLIFFPDRQKKYFVSSDGSVKIPYDSGLVNALINSQTSIEIDEIEDDIFKNNPKIKEELAKGVVVPFILENELRGIMILGKRSDGRLYNLEELDFLSVINRPLGILLERNILLKAIKEEESKNIQMEKLASLGRMTAGIAHEFRNPLNVISTAAETIIRKKDDKIVVEKLLNFIIEEVDRLNKIVRDFLKLSKPVVPELKTGKILPFLNSIIDKIKLQYNQSNIEVRINCENDGELRADFGLLSQALTNIISNAYEAMGSSGILTIDTKSENGKFIISISDTGGGIDPNKADKIFEPFFTTREQGTGLGLSIADSFILGMGGELTFHNNDKGAVFTIVLQENKK